MPRVGEHRRACPGVRPLLIADITLPGIWKCPKQLEIFRKIGGRVLRMGRAVGKIPHGPISVPIWLLMRCSAYTRSHVLSQTPCGLGFCLCFAIYVKPL